MRIVHPETALVPHIRGELFAAEREVVAAHIVKCAQCRQRVESFRWLLGELSSRVEQLPAPAWDDYEAELQQQLEGGPWLRWRPSFNWRPSFDWRPGLIWRPAFKYRKSVV
jgi:anti-sigma factor RsiW